MLQYMTDTGIYSFLPDIRKIVCAIISYNKTQFLYLLQ